MKRVMAKAYRLPVNGRLRQGMISLALILSLVTAAPETPPAPQLVLTGVGRFALFADRATIAADGDGVRMRALQVSERGFAVAGTEYWGGWSWWRFDCTARTADRLDFASLKAGGDEGPSTPDAAPPHEISAGGDSAELAAVACAAEPPPAYTDNVEDAVSRGQAMLAGEIDPPL